MESNSGAVVSFADAVAYPYQHPQHWGYWHSAAVAMPSFAAAAVVVVAGVYFEVKWLNGKKKLSSWNYSEREKKPTEMLTW